MTKPTSLPLTTTTGPPHLLCAYPYPHSFPLTFVSSPTTSTVSPLQTSISAGTYGITDNLDDLSQGLTPYLVNHRAQGNKAAIVETNSGDHDRMLSGETAPSLSEC
jgi:hypothetical protein